MARKPQPGGDRNAWGAVLNEYLDVSHNPDGTIKPGGVGDAVTMAVETALSVQLVPAVADAVAADSTVVAAAAAAVDAEPRVSDLIASSERVDPGSTGPAPGYQIAQGIMGPVWKSGPVNADWFSHVRDAANTAGVGGIVEFSKGVQYLTTDSGIEVQTGQSFRGNGATLVFRGDFGFKSKTPGTQAKSVHIRDVTISGWNDMGIGIDFRTVIDSHVSHVTLNGYVDYGVMFGGTNDVGGWSNSLSHSRIWSSPVSSKSDSAAVWLGGTTSGGVPNANNITIFSNRIQSHNAYAIYINKGDGNHIIANDMGYGWTHPAVFLTGGWATRGNSFLTNRYEKTGGSLVIDDANDNLLLGEYYGTPDPNYTGFNVRVLAGTGNVIQPAQAGAGSASDWAQVNVSGNTVTYQGRACTRTSSDPILQSRRLGEANNRFNIEESGRMLWGGGGTPDVQLDRFAANVLRLAAGDSLYIENGTIRMAPRPAPASGVVGEMYMATGGKLMVCTVAGTPGTWVPVGTQT